MSRRFSPILSTALGKLFRASRPLEEGAPVEVWGEEVRREAHEAIYFADDLNRVAGFAPYQTRAQEWERLKGGPRTYPAGWIYRLADVTAVGGNLYRGFSKRLIEGKTSGFVKSVVEWTYEDAVLVDSANGAHYFGDWLLDDLPCFADAGHWGTAVTIRSRAWSHQPQYEVLLVGHHPERTPPAVYFPRLAVFPEGIISSCHLQQWEEFRSMLSTPRGATAEGVYLARGRAGQNRGVSNEPEILHALIKRGFRVVEPEALTVGELVEQCAGAKVIVGVEGSHMTHGLYTVASGGSLVVIQPPHRFNNPIKERCDALGIFYGFTVGYPEGKAYRVDIQRLLDLLDRVGSSTS